jgi:hypothetical protein
MSEQFHPVSSSALDGGSSSRPNCFTPCERAPVTAEEESVCTAKQSGGNGEHKTEHQLSGCYALILPNDGIIILYYLRANKLRQDGLTEVNMELCFPLSVAVTVCAQRATVLLSTAALLSSSQHGLQRTLPNNSILRCWCNCAVKNVQNFVREFKELQICHHHHHHHHWHNSPF